MRKTLAVALVCVGILGGFPLEKWKISLNFLIEFAQQFPQYDTASDRERQAAVEARKTPSGADYYYSHQTPLWMFSLNTSELNRTKWGLALAAVAVFSALNLWVIWLWFGRKRYVLHVAWGLSALLLLCFLIYVPGLLLPEQKGFYAVARQLLGGIQSVVPLMAMVPALELYEFYRHNHPNSES